MIKAISYSLSDDFIKRLADFIEENYISKGRGLSGLAVIFGGRRPGLFLKKELSGRLKKSFVPCRLFSIDEFVQYVVDKERLFRMISGSEACYLIYNLAKGLCPGILRNRESFAQFLPWSREILSFMEQLDLESITGVSLKNIELKASIGYDVPEDINILLKDIAVIREAFHASLKEKGLYSRGLVYSTAASLIKSRGLEEFEEFVFAGFFYAHRTECMIMKELLGRKKATLIFQGQAKEWSVLEKLQKELGVAIEAQEEKERDFKLNIYAGFDLHSQAGIAREVLENISSQDKTVIVLPDPQSVIPLLSEISSCVKDFNVSIGYPLKQSSVCSLFEAVKRAQETKRDNSYYARDYLRVISHPLLKNLKLVDDNPAVTRVLVHKIEELLNGRHDSGINAAVFVSLEEIEGCRELFDLCLLSLKSFGFDAQRRNIEGALKRLHGIAFSAWERSRTLLDFSRNLKEFMDCLVDKSPLESYPLNLKASQSMYALIKEMQEASFCGERFPLDELFSIFEDGLKNEVVSFKGSPLKGLQVLGLFETRSLNFENVIFMDANESILPKLKVYEPLIPREVMVSLGLNRLEKEEEIQRYQFKRLIASSKNAHLIYARNDKRERSRFIEELVWQKQKQAGRMDVLGEQRGSYKVKAVSVRHQVDKNERMVGFLKQMRYSASRVDVYLNCPLRFYYKYVLGLEEKDDLLGEAQGKDIGNFLHGFLYDSFSSFVGLAPLIDQKFEGKFFNELSHSFEAQLGRKFQSESFLVKEVLEYRMKRFLEHEKTRKVRKVVFLEKKIVSDIAFSGATFGFEARIDRLDELEDGSFLVIDYKSGSSDILPEPAERIQGDVFSRKVLQERVRSFQLPLYLLLLEGAYPTHLLNACLYNLRMESDIPLEELFKAAKDPDIKKASMDVYKLALESVLKEITDPYTGFSADDTAGRQCEHCPFFCMCK